jgi:hypothetical protein
MSSSPLVLVVCEQPYYSLIPHFLLLMINYSNYCVERCYFERRAWSMRDGMRWEEEESEDVRRESIDKIRITRTWDTAADLFCSIVFQPRRRRCFRYRHPIRTTSEEERKDRHTSRTEHASCITRLILLWSNYSSLTQTDWWKKHRSKKNITIRWKDQNRDADTRSSRRSNVWVRDESSFYAWNVGEDEKNKMMKVKRWKKKN